MNCPTWLKQGQYRQPHRRAGGQAEKPAKGPVEQRQDGKGQQRYRQPGHIGGGHGAYSSSLTRRSR